jgi:hypothetical protein
MVHIEDGSYLEKNKGKEQPLQKDKEGRGQ